MRLRWIGVGACLALVVASCGWDRPRFDAGNSGANPYESTISSANVAGLVKQRSTTPDINSSQTVVVHRNLLYAGINAFAVDGSSHCSGSPSVCAPLFRTAGGAADVDGDSLFHGRSAFDPAGVSGCTGDPGTCSPLWTGGTGTPSGSVDPSTLHFTATVTSSRGSEVITGYGYSKTGDQGCGGTPKVCAPLWSAELYSGSAAGGAYFAGPRDGLIWDTVSTPLGSRLEARDATAGTGDVVWWAGLGQYGGGRPPVLVGNLVIGNTRGTNAQGWAAYRADGSGCSPGAPKVCTDPVWVTDAGPVGYTEGAIAVAGGRMFRTDATTLKVYDVAGIENCTGSATKTCTPLWTAATGGTTGPPAAPAVANGLVFVGADNGSVNAFDAHGVTNCSGTPRVCAPLWTGHVSGQLGDVVVSGGRLFVPSSDGTVTVFGLP